MSKTLDSITAAGHEIQARTGFYKLVVAILGIFLIGSLVANMILMNAMFYRFPVKQFLWTKDARAVCEAAPLSEPVITDARLNAFASGAALEIHSYDYINWRRNISDATSRYFTPEGAERFKADFAASRILEQVRQNYYVVAAVPFDIPVITERGRDAGRYYWDVEVPITIHYRQGNQFKPENRVLTMRVVRVDPSPENPNGIGIDGLVSTQVTNTNRRTN